MTLATCVAGVVLALWLMRGRVGNVPRAVERVEDVVREPKMFAVATNRVETAKHAARAVDERGVVQVEKKGLPDWFVRDRIQKAMDDEDYEGLSFWLKYYEQIEDPETRLMLLNGLAWFEGTAVQDALAFVLDDDEEVAATACDIITTHLREVKDPMARGEMYALTLKYMGDTADQDILVAMLEAESKDMCIWVLKDLECVRETRPELWKKVTDVYTEQTGREYTTWLDAMMNKESKRGGRMHLRWAR